MANTDLAIKIATTLDATGLNKADKAVKRFDKTVSRLGRNLGLTLGTAAMVTYGKAAVKAFAADEAAANRLSTAVDNLGLSFSNAKVASFISQLEQSAAIADDVLRPAFQGLLTTTGSLVKSQELLNNAIQISRASGVDLATVATDLGKGYVGITRGLVKYNTGLTRAEITTKSFNEILGIMLARSAGAAQDYLTTTSYKMEVLTVAAGNAQETIGMGLVDAFAKLGGGSSATDAAQTINNIAKGINAVTNAAATAVGAVVKLYKGLDFLTSFGGRTGANGSIAQYADSVEARLRQFENPRSKSPAGTAQRTAQQRQAEATAAKRAKELAALQTKQVKSQKALTDEQKKQNALKKAGSIFDLEQIQIIAALQGNLSKEDKTRLEAQLALLNGNAAVATALTKQILMSQDATGQLYKLWQTLPDARNPFAYLEEYLNGLAKKAAAVLSGGASGTAPVTPTNVTPSVVGTPFGQAGSSQEAQAIKQLGTPFGQAGGNGSGFVGTPFGQAPIVVQIDGKTIATALQDQSLSGISSSVNRTYGSFAGR
jgi:hypothetical protein